MRTENDWRLTNQLSYLKRAELNWRRYSPSNPDNDHDHCEFCTVKFMTEPRMDAFAEGYSTIDGYRWICKECFVDFMDLFDWKITKAMK